MKSKLVLSFIVVSSALLLSACDAKNVSTDSSQSNGQNQVQTQSKNGQTNPSSAPGQGKMIAIDYAAAAKTLNITEKVLKEALGVTDTATVTGKPSGVPIKMDLAAAAKKLNITETVLREALGLKDMPQGGTDTPPGDQPQGNPPSDDSQSNN